MQEYKYTKLYENTLITVFCAVNYSLPRTQNHQEMFRNQTLNDASAHSNINKIMFDLFTFELFIYLFICVGSPLDVHAKSGC